MKLSPNVHRAIRTAVPAAAAVALGIGPAALPAIAAAPFVKVQAPGFYRMMLGDFEITALNDGIIPLPAAKLLAEPAAKTRAALKRSYVSDPVATSDNAYLVNTGSKLVLIDVGGGDLLGPTLGKLVENLRAAGYRPEQIDDVLITHMHPDHVGGLVKKGEAVFPNATIHADRRDSDYWLSKANSDKAPAEGKAFFQGAVASLSPYIAAGRYQPFDGSGEVVSGIRSLSSYGHTAGHTSYLIESKGQQLVILGDLIHVAAVQLDDPSVTIAFDTDPRAAAASRQKIFARVATEGAFVGAEHLQFPGLGHLRARNGSWSWIPVNYQPEVR